MFTNEIIEKRNLLLHDLNDYEAAIKAIRKSSSDWKDRIEKDDRPAVKILYKSYIEALEAYNNFMDKSWNLKGRDIDIDFDKYYTSEEILSLMLNNMIPSHRKVDACYKNHQTFGIGFYIVGNSCYYIYDESYDEEKVDEKESQVCVDFFRLGYLFRITHEMVEN